MSETEITLIDPIADFNNWPAMKTGWNITLIDNKPSLEIDFLFNETEYYGLLNVVLKDPEKKILTVAYTLPPDPDAAVDKARYSFDADISILGITLNDDKNSVDIAVGQIPEDGVATLWVNEMEFTGIKDTYSGSAGFSTDAEFKDISLLNAEMPAAKNLYEGSSTCFDPRQPVTVVLKASLFPEQAFTLNEAGFHLWLKHIVLFLEARLKGGPVNEIPERTYKFTFPVDPASADKKSVLELFLTPYLTDGNLKALSGGKMIKIKPLSGFPDGDSGRAGFVEEFEKIFLPKNGLKVAFGKDRSEDPSAWAIRIIAEDSQPFIGYQIEDKAAVVLAPKPVFNNLLGKSNVPLPVFDPVNGLDFSEGRTMAFNDIDLNEWFRDFFRYFDSLSDPAYAGALELKEGPADQGMTFREKLEGQRERLADRLKNLLVPVFEKETVFAGDAQEAFGKAVSERLSHFYELKSVLQLSAEIAPNNLIAGCLSGHIFADQPEYGRIPEIRTAASDLPLHPAGTAGLQVMLYSPEISEDLPDLPVPADLSYQVTSLENCRVEPETGDAPPVSLAFFTKDNPLLSARKLPALPERVPLPLSRCPVAPLLHSPSGNAVDFRDGNLAGLLQWEFRFSYSRINRHDRMDFTVYDHQPEPFESGSGQKNFGAFDDLAQLLHLQPRMQETIGALTGITGESPDDAVSAAKVMLNAYTGLVENFINHIAIDDFWGVNLSGYENGAPEGLFSFTLKEGITTIGNTEDAVTVTIALSTEDTEKYGFPEIEIEAYQTVLHKNTEVIPGSGTYYFTRDGKPLSFAEAEAAGIISRTLIFSTLNITCHSDLAVSAVIKRNLELVPGKKVNPVFQMTGPAGLLPAFSMMIDCPDALDMASFAPDKGKKYTLPEHLSHLFTGLLQKNEHPKLYFQLVVSYEYTIAGTGIPVQLPVVLRPVGVLTGPDNRHAPHPGISEPLAAAVNEWLQINNPGKENAMLKMDLTLYGQENQPKPLLRLSGLYLKMEDMEQ
ncbi:hypothetical protein [Chryseobacterium hagamense]|uniref:Uncharacterized protein n=1 Tax=Chryseobacterium hagamense TaxID=395935 RepID=A0A511YGG3_9FLAO|nr:hypothetical protein [Chryseobacterium hagamense]GEN74297.1 hypothetical protein CHA01nite_00370 [Chryseobacterium hagamense]